jgi:NADP-dependent 3-hydroxy acid dehydrogenase YdfG
VPYLHSTDGVFETIDAVLHGGVQAMAMQADLSRTRDIASIVEHRVEKLASINRRVNNADAIMQPAHGEPMSDGTWDQALNVHVKSGSMMMR